MKRFFGKLLTLSATAALAILVVGPTLSVKAAEEATPEPNVVITKTFIAPDKTVVTMPTEFNFEFEVAEVSFTPHGTTEADDSVTVPDISDKILTFTPATDLGTTTAGATTVYKQTANLLEGIQFPEAGVYEYTIKEKADTNALADSEKEELVYSTATYKLYVYVSRDENGEPIVDGGTVEDLEGNKVDPKPTPPTTGGGENEVEAANGFNFTNIYKKQAGSVTPPDPNNPDAGLVVSKAITGDLANATDEFTYSFFLEATPLVFGKDYILETPAGQVTVTPGTAVTFVLKGGEKALLMKVPAGAAFTVEETEFGYYTPSNVLELNSVPTASESNVKAGGVLGENSNKADYTNNWETTTPTGLILNNLPYVLLIVLATGGFGLYLVNKRRHRA